MLTYSLGRINIRPIFAHLGKRTIRYFKNPLRPLLKENVLRLSTARSATAARFCARKGTLFSAFLYPLPSQRREARKI